MLWCNRVFITRTLHSADLSMPDIKLFLKNMIKIWCAEMENNKTAELVSLALTVYLQCVTDLAYFCLIAHFGDNVIGNLCDMLTTARIGAESCVGSTP